MRVKLMKWVSDLIEQRRQSKRWHKFAVILAVAAAFVTIYALLIPAVTMENTVKTLDCAVEVHTHTENCYNENSNLICGYADYVVHTHNSSCYNADGELVCELPEIEEHKHEDLCYTEKQVPICGQEENESHTHNADCYTAEKVLACGRQKLHAHTDTCYDESGNLVCGLLELKEHTHNDDCFEETTESSAEKIQAVKTISIPRKVAATSSTSVNNGSTITMKVGESKSVYVTISGAKDGGKFTWTPNNNNVSISDITVGDKSNGKSTATLTANSVGTVTVVVKGYKKGKTTVAGTITFTVNVTADIQETPIDKGNYAVDYGSTLSLTANGTGTSETWVSNDTSILTVSGSGTSATVTPVSVGTTTVTHTYTSGNTKYIETYTITVNYGSQSRTYTRLPRKLKFFIKIDDGTNEIQP